MNGKHDQTHASLYVCTYVQASTCIYKHVCIHSYTKHECVYLHSMYNAYVCVYQYLFLSIYVHYLLFLISIQYTKCFMNLKSITKKNIAMYKILFKSKFNTSRFLQNVYAYNQIDRACRYRNQTGRNTICMNLESNKSICCVLVRNITFDNTSLVL